MITVTSGPVPTEPGYPEQPPVESSSPEPPVESSSPEEPSYPEEPTYPEEPVESSSPEEPSVSGYPEEPVQAAAGRSTLALGAAVVAAFAFLL